MKKDKIFLDDYKNEGIEIIQKEEAKKIIKDFFEKNNFNDISNLLENEYYKNYSNNLSYDNCVILYLNMLDGYIRTYNLSKDEFIPEEIIILESINTKIDTDDIDDEVNLEMYNKVKERINNGIHNNLEMYNKIINIQYIKDFPKYKKNIICDINLYDHWISRGYIKE